MRLSIMRRRWLQGMTLGCVGGLWMWLLQSGAAVLGGHRWVLEQPLLALLLYPLVGGLIGGLASIPLELIRRFASPGTDPGAFLAVWIGLGGFLVRGISSIEMVLGGRWSAHALLLGLTIVAGVVGIRRLSTWTGGRTVLVGSAIFAVEFSIAYLFHLAFLADRHRPLLLGGDLGTVALLGLAGIIGLLATLALAAAENRRGLRWAAALALVALTGRYLVGRQQEPSTTTGVANRPNVLLIVVDTLRRDAVSAYGLTADVTPNLDRLAAGGVRWTDVAATGNWTIPTHATLFTGAQVTRHGAGGGGRQRLRPYPAGPDTDELPTLAEVFSDNGWRTMAYVCNANLSRANAFDRGFDEYHEIWQYRSGNYDLLAQLAKKAFGLGSWDLGSVMVTRALESFFTSASAQNGPWFLFANVLEPHAPYTPPEPWRSRFASGPISWESANELSQLVIKHPFGPHTEQQRDILWSLYLASVAYQDHLLGRFLDALEAHGLADETIVLITSDHGENFGWQGHLSHGQSLNDDLIRLPMIARGPGLPPAAVSEAPVSLIDVMPTLLYLARLPAGREDAGKPGVVMPPIGPDIAADRMRLVERYGFTAEEMRNHFAEADNASDWWNSAQSALLMGPWKLRLSGSADGPSLTRLDAAVRPPLDDGRVEVTDPALAAELLERLLQMQASWPAALNSEPTDEAMDEQTRRQLEALGYLDN